MIKMGQPAPEFKGDAYVNGEFKPISLRDYRGKWVVFFFYPLDFTFVCPTELRSFAKHEKEFKEAGAQVIACSIDSKYSHKAWFERDLKEVQYPVLSDITKSVSRAYDVLNEDAGIANRGVFIIDPEGNVKYANVTDLSVGRSTDEVLRALKATQAAKNGELCPADWKPGDSYLKK
ncbi:MAG TPA: peroxiredoxin [Bdellovibrionota bacterium]|nr:peroxiredoxin [Bdellovibrionota bacterium]